MRKGFMKDNSERDIHKLIQEKKRHSEELKQIEDETHQTLVNAINKIDERLHLEIIKLKNMCQFKIDEINHEHEAELKLLDKEATDYYRDYIEHSINELENKKKVLENEKNTIDINSSSGGASTISTINELENKKKVLENEKNTIDINSSSGGDILEIKPMSTRKLRRRGQDSSCVNESMNNTFNGLHDSFNLSANNSYVNNSIPIGSGFISNFNPDVSQMFGVGQGFGASSIGNLSTQVSDIHQVESISNTSISNAKKKRLNGSSLSTQLNTILPESSIYSDLLKIQRSCGKVNNNHVNQGNNTSLSGSNNGTPTSKRHSNSALHAVNINDKQLFRSSERAESSLQIWVDDGRLFLGNKCIHQNMNVTVESRDNCIHKCICTVLCIGVQDISLKRLSDNGIFKVPLLHIRNGKTLLSPCANSGIKRFV